MVHSEVLWTQQPGAPMQTRVTSSMSRKGCSTCERWLSQQRRRQVAGQWQGRQLPAADNKGTKRMGKLAPNFPYHRPRDKPPDHRHSRPHRQCIRGQPGRYHQPDPQYRARQRPDQPPPNSRPLTAQPADPVKCGPINGIQHAPQHAPRALDTWWIAARADTLGGRGTTLMTPWYPGMRRGGQCVAREGEGPEVDSCDIVVLPAGPT